MKYLLARCAKLLGDPIQSTLASVGLLLIRISIGAFMAFGHGWGKLARFSEISAEFPDPLGVGHTLSLAMTVSAEFFCSLAIIVGLATRLAAIPLAFTMVVAAFIIHDGDPWQKKEFAMLYLIPYLALVFTGPGKFSLDAMIRSKI